MLTLAGGLDMARICAIALAWLTIAATLAVARPQLAADWNGGTGNWTDSTKWSTGAVPNNTPSNTYSVTIDGASSFVYLFSQNQSTSYRIDALNVLSDARLRFFPIDTWSTVLE